MDAFKNFEKKLDDNIVAFDKKIQLSTSSEFIKIQQEKQASEMTTQPVVTETLEYLLNIQSLEYLSSEKFRPIKDSR